jgi:dienelactone hydrolase
MTATRGRATSRGSSATEPLARSRSAAALFENRYASRPRTLAAPRSDDPEVWSTWQQSLRKRIIERLGVDFAPGSNPTFEIIEDVEEADFRRLGLMVESAPGAPMPVWLLLPHHRHGLAPAVIAIHGHGSGVNEIVGLDPLGNPRADPAGYQKDFALSLVRRGFVVAAPELLGFGARREASDVAAGAEESSCRALATWALMLGSTLIGERVADLVRVVDVLSGRDEVDPSAIGIFGISGGATAALFTAVTDERIAAAVLSGYVTSFRASVLAIDHCICNVVPGLVADVEMTDLALGLLPRPLLLEAGREDTIFPVEAAKLAAERIAAGYAALGVAERFDIDIFDGGHEISGARAFDFLGRWLARARTGNAA